MSHSAARPSNAERHQRRAARPRPSAHPYLRPSSSLADALGGEGPPPLYPQPSAREQAAAATTTTTTTTSAAAQYDFGDPVPSYGSSSSSRAQQNGESSRLAWGARQYEEARHSAVGHFPSRKTGDVSSLANYNFPSTSQPYASPYYAPAPSNYAPCPSSYGPTSSSSRYAYAPFHQTFPSSVHQAASSTTYNAPSSSTAAYYSHPTAATQPFPLHADQPAADSDAPPFGDVSTEESWDSTNLWALEPVLEAYFNVAAIESLQSYDIGADHVSTHSSLDPNAHSLPGPASFTFTIPQDTLPSPQAPPGHALTAPSSLSAIIIPAATFDMTHPPSLEEQLREKTFWAGYLHCAPLLPALNAGKRYRIPLPPGTEEFAEPIVVDGRLGLQCRRCRGIRKSIANRFIFANVARAEMNVDYAFDKADIYVHRGVWKCDPRAVYVFNSTSKKKPATGFKLGHLLTAMAAKQYKTWYRKEFLPDPDRAKDLQDLVGSKLAPKRGVRVRWENVYMVAVRRMITDEDSKAFHYFPELEIRL